MARGIFNGRFVNIDYSSLQLDEELLEAMQALDADCAHGCGGTWEIFEEEGGTWRAVFLDMATDELVWDADEGSWDVDYGDDDEDEEDEEDEEYMLAFVG